MSEIAHAPKDVEAVGAPVLSVSNLSITFNSPAGPVRAVDDVSFSLARGRILGLVGESGCGKSVTASSLLGLVRSAQTGGRILFDGHDLAGLSEEDWQSIRGSAISMIFQEPMTSLNPVFTVGEQIAEVLRVHRRLSRAQAHEQAVVALRRVNIPAPEERAKEYPHRLSGGMRQRVMIAMALACEPQVLIADEPTTALDVTVQAQILALIDELRRRQGTAVLFITHDLGVIAEFADDVAVMYLGNIVERGAAADLLNSPQHPYTLGLLGSTPKLDARAERLTVISGQVPMPSRRPSGCTFHQRCPFADEHCARDVPPHREIAPAHWVSCWKAPIELHA
ncbi:MAG: ABC transporter ATP-binding protein [Rhizobiales bacterium]|nr:ABC transporter ATP-binding protein [Hyphomicrobiales bacterium]